VIINLVLFSDLPVKSRGILKANYGFGIFFVFLTHSNPALRNTMITSGTKEVWIFTDYQIEQNFANRKLFIYTFYSNFQPHCFPDVGGSREQRGWECYELQNNTFVYFEMMKLGQSIVLFSTILYLSFILHTKIFPSGRKIVESY
jgi:hypothetical protein